MRSPHAISLRIAGITLAGLVILTACGGDDDAPDTTATQPVEAQADSEGAESAGDEPAAEPGDAPEPAPEPTATATPAPEPTATPTPEPEPMLTLDVTGLPDLDGGAEYEAWLIVDDVPVSAGTFGSFTGGVTLPVTDAGAATAVIVTIETDDDPAPAASHVLAGPLVDSAARLSVTDSAAIGVDFAGARGEYILATPTDGTGSPENERSGIWWTFIPREQSLVLPELPAGWIYEGWQVIDGVPVTTGTFVSQFGEPDLAAPFSGPQPGPPFPGEDFVANAPDGLTFPRDLRGTEVVITVEPLPDTSPAPFPIVPLRGTVPADAVDHTSYAVDNVADVIVSGTARVG